MEGEELGYGIGLKDKKLGVIGFGNIKCRYLNAVTKAFDMQVIAYNPYINPNKAL